VEKIAAPPLAEPKYNLTIDLVRVARTNSVRGD
jgi:hypothetical protein